MLDGKITIGTGTTTIKDIPIGLPLTEDEWRARGYLGSPVTVPQDVLQEAHAGFRITLQASGREAIKSGNLTAENAENWVDEWIKGAKSATVIDTTEQEFSAAQIEFLRKQGLIVR